jgi:hypothetical protein
LPEDWPLDDHVTLLIRNRVFENAAVKGVVERSPAHYQRGYLPYKPVVVAVGEIYSLYGSYNTVAHIWKLLNCGDALKRRNPSEFEG